jgi:homoaconitase/3-isopropylmalate dehydratase large subunit
MNVVEKILAARSGKAKVAPDDVVITGVDVMVMHDLSANFVMKVFENEMSGARIANPDKIVFAFDHNFAPRYASSPHVTRSVTCLTAAAAAFTT